MTNSLSALNQLAEYHLYMLEIIMVLIQNLGEHYTLLEKARLKYFSF